MSIKDDCTAVILCGGKSSRMGFDKVFLKIGDEYLINKKLDIINKKFKNILLVTNNNQKKQILESILDYPVKIDIYPDCGPIGGIITGISESKTPYVFVTACDMPKIDLDLIETMYQELGDFQVMVCEREDGRLETLHSFYHESCLEVFRMQIKENNYQIRKNFSSFTVKKHRIHKEQKENFRNLNTIKDIENWNSDSTERINGNLKSTNSLE